MSEFLVPPDPTRDAPPAPGRPRAGSAPARRRPRAQQFPGAAVRVAPVPGGVRLLFAPTEGHTAADALAAALADVVARECRDEGFLRFAVEVQSDGAAVGLTITGPVGLGAPTAAACRILMRGSGPPHT